MLNCCSISTPTSGSHHRTPDRHRYAKHHTTLPNCCYLSLLGVRHRSGKWTDPGKRNFTIAHMTPAEEMRRLLYGAPSDGAGIFPRDVPPCPFKIDDGD